MYINSRRRECYSTGLLSRLIAVSVLIALHGLAAPAISIAETDKNNLCAAAPKALEIAAKIRGLKPKSAVSCRVQNKEEVRKFILDQVNTKIPSERLRLEEGIYKTIGLIPESFDYKNGLLDLYSEQIGGYYDPDTKQFTMASWMPLNAQFTVAVHELTHSLQDQYFNISQFQDYTKLTTDEQLAASALIEGDATAVMIDEKMPAPGIRGMSNVDPLVAAQAMAAALMVQGTRPVPESLKMLIIFPYSEGLRLVHALLRTGGYLQIDKAFTKMPKTTKEILSPSNYLNGFKAAEFLPSSDCKNNAACQIVHTDSLGEFMLRTTLIANQISGVKAQRLAAGWTGDRLEILKQNETEEVLWRISLASAADATNLLNELRQIKFKMAGSVLENTVTLRAPITESKKLR